MREHSHLYQSRSHVGTTISTAEHYAHLAAAPHRTLKGLDLEINSESLPKNYKDAVSRKDLEQWGDAMMQE